MKIVNQHIVEDITKSLFYSYSMWIFHAPLTERSQLLFLVVLFRWPQQLKEVTIADL